MELETCQPTSTGGQGNMVSPSIISMLQALYWNNLEGLGKPRQGGTARTLRGHTEDGCKFGEASSSVTLARLAPCRLLLLGGLRHVCASPMDNSPSQFHGAKLNGVYQNSPTAWSWKGGGTAGHGNIVTDIRLT
ncbi:hypothetical protein JMJ77_0003314 [Colletotrichum scovillei]|uniref:Uncharacterized protein n=1 Tax=Colletotrichum scovillei TaxID=1209932 RepID=A0A9P7QYZ5_9PEZI|nr:hypothetical protein JMJ78_0006526 [Colletotrichum scovillei]KAG7043611.1 hypothetical protein JMJ77_0003314 [Colletotrichum scovillei]KAG7063065.1 hypothetical protein JMJ76_0009904 [Colletotrichum scovillei]